jgi:hypothetical protein
MPSFKAVQGQLAHHRHLDDGRYLSTFHTQHGAAQNMVCLGVDDGLHEAARLARLQGADHGIHGQFRHTDIASLFSGLIFAQANTPELGIDENGVGDKAILRVGAAMFKQVGAQNAEVIVRGVLKAGPPLTSPSA